MTDRDRGARRPAVPALGCVGERWQEAGLGGLLAALAGDVERAQEGLDRRAVRPGHPAGRPDPAGLPPVPFAIENVSLELELAARLARRPRGPGLAGDGLVTRVVLPEERALGAATAGPALRLRLHVEREAPPGAAPRTDDREAGDA